MQYIPFFGKLPKEWEVGESYIIQGRVKLEAKEDIYFDFFSESGPKGDIAFRLCIRSSENKIYRQSLIDGQWETEATDAGFPFGPGNDFEVVFVAEQDYWKVLVNNQLFCTYEYSTELSRVLYLHIEGPVTINSVAPAGNIAD